jgi:ankyrin repeat protein
MELSSQEMDRLRILSTQDYEDSLHNIRTAHPGTLSWILEHGVYQEWEQSWTPRTLLITGPPGSGKSVLSKYLIERMRAERREGTIVCYYFFKRRSRDSRNVSDEFAGAIVHQLLRALPSLIGPTMNIILGNSRAIDSRRWLHTVSLPRIFQSVLEDPRCGSVVCVLDGLDECAKPDRRNILDFLDRLVSELGSSAAGRCPLRLLLTSRPVRERGWASPEWLNMNLDPSHTSKDVTQYVQSRIIEIIQDDHLNAVSEMVISEAKGSFGIASMLLDEVRHNCSEGDIADMLENPTQFLMDIYGFVISNSQYPKRTIELIQIVAAATRPLTLIEFGIASEIFEHDKRTRLNYPGLLDFVQDELEHFCQGLVYIVDDRVFLVSQSVAGAVDDKFRNRREYGDGGHEVLGRRCISYLLLDDFKKDPLPSADTQISAYLERYPFLEYAANNWARHTRFWRPGPDAMGNTVMECLFRLCDTKSEQFRTWFNVHWVTAPSPSIRHPIGCTDLMVASYLGLTVTVVRLLESGVAIEELDKHGQSALHLAASNGHLETVKLLIDAGANPLADDSKNITSLHLAASNGHLETVKLLASVGADPRAEDIEKTTALHLAGSNGYLETVKFLKDAGADPRAEDIGKTTPLHLAASNGHLEIIEFLIGVGADPRAENIEKATPIYLAASNGHLEIVRFLIDAGADLRAEDIKKTTPLHLAASNGHLETVKFLIDLSADPRAENADKATPIYLAAGNGHLEIIRFLIHAGADPRAEDIKKITPLHLAASNGYLETAKFLTEAGADPRAKDAEKTTPLHLATSNGRLETVKFLINAGADPRAEDTEVSTPLHLAARNGHHAVVDYLLNHGAFVDAQDKYGRTSLHYAAINGNEDVARVLLKSNPDLELTDFNDDTAMMAPKTAATKGVNDAAQAAENAVVQLLETVEFSAQKLTNILNPSLKESDEKFQAFIADFVSGAVNLQHNPSILDLLGQEKAATWLLNNKSQGTVGDFHWLHLPANNVRSLKRHKYMWFANSELRQMAWIEVGFMIHRRLEGNNETEI